ncbi:MAG: hypothetical protein AB1522_11500 [Chloroflexota bacterium]
MTQSPKIINRSTLLQILLVLALCAGSMVLLNLLGVFRPPPTEAALVFRVEATGGYANITLQAGKEVISKTTTVTTPWEKRVVVPRGEEVYLTASNPSQTGQLSCAILLEGRVWKNERTEAPKDGVACAGIVP